MRVVGICLTLALFCPCALGQPADGQAPLDMARVRSLVQRSKAGETLSAEDQAYLQRAKEMRALQQQGPAAGKPASGGTLRTDIDLHPLVPLTDMTAPYKGEDGGLYGSGRSDPPAEHYAGYLKQSEQICPLDADGRPTPDGKIGLITIGFSNTHLESMAFVKAANDDPQKSPHVVVMDGAIGLRSAVMWAWDGCEVLPEQEQDRLEKQMDLLHMPKKGRRGMPGMPDRDTWPTLNRRLAGAGLSPRQVQVLWMKHVEAQPRLLGEFPAHAKALQQDMADILIIARKRFPNLRVALLSSRTFAGWSSAFSGSPEPYAYESGFATRWLIQAQIKGDALLNYDPDPGPVTAPILLWGPYLWACGDAPRASDGLVWSVKHVRDDDHLHPSDLGCRTVADLLMKFLKIDRGTRRWYAAP